MITDTDTLAGLIQNMTDDERAFLSADSDVMALMPKLTMRDRFEATLSAAKETSDAVQQKIVQGALAAEDAMQGKPYQTVGTVFVIGFAAGYLLTRSIR